MAYLNLMWGLEFENTPLNTIGLGVWIIWGWPDRPRIESDRFLAELNPRKLVCMARVAYSL